MDGLVNIYGNQAKIYTNGIILICAFLRYIEIQMCVPQKEKIPLNNTLIIFFLKENLDGTKRILLKIIIIMLYLVRGT